MSRLEEVLSEQMEKALLAEGFANPLPEEDARRLLTKCVDVLRQSAVERGDEKAAASLAEPTAVIVERLIAKRKELDAGDTTV